jgi:hypothetical protein
VFGTTLSGAIYVHDTVNIKVLFGEYSGLAIVGLGLLSYDLVYKICLYAIKNVDFVKKIYWGSMYLEGLWEYASFDGKKDFIGIWKIEQDAFRTTVVAFGLDSDFRRRSTVQSVSDLMGADGVFEVINRRWDVNQNGRFQFSRTVLVPDKSVRRLFFSYPSIIRGETAIFGGKEDGIINYDLRMWRRDEFKTEDALIQNIRKKDSQPQSQPAFSPTSSDPPQA